MEQGLLKSLTAKENDKNNIFIDSFDKLVFEDVVEESKKLRATLANGKEVLDTFPSLAEDIFASLYKLEPSLKPDIPFGTELNRKELISMFEHSQYNDLRTYSVLDDYSSALACETIMNEVIIRLSEDKDLKDLVDKQNQATRNEENKSNKEKAEISQELENLTNKIAGKLRRAIGRGCQMAQRQAEDNSKIADAMGWSDEGGEFSKLNIEDKTKLFDQAKRMYIMADIIGKIRNITKRTRQNKIKSEQVEICGVEFGSNLPNVLPQELGLLSNPILKLEFYRKLADKQLLQYELKRKEYLGKGSLVVLLDDSGSMGSNQRREYARGAAIGLLDVAKSEKRNFALEIFSSEGCNKKFEYPKGNADMAAVIEIMQVHFGGGTSYHEPILWALEKIAQDEYKDADIVLITDGNCNLTTDLINIVKQKKEELNIKIHAITLECRPTHLSEWCDSIWTNLDTDSLEDIIGGI